MPPGSSRLPREWFWIAKPVCIGSKAAIRSPLDHQQAKAYIAALNRQNWAGRGDWRLPSLGELASLLTPEKTVYGLHLPAVFDSRQRFCWSASLSATGRGAYGVMFDPGTILAKTTDHKAFIRAVAG